MTLSASVDNTLSDCVIVVEDVFVDGSRATKGQCYHQDARVCLFPVLSRRFPAFRELHVAPLSSIVWGFVRFVTGGGAIYLGQYGGVILGGSTSLQNSSILGSSAGKLRVSRRQRPWVLVLVLVLLLVLVH